MQTRSVNPRPHRVGRQIARARDLFVAKAAHLAHQKHIAVEIGQRCERLVDGGVDLLRCRPRRIDKGDPRRFCPMSSVMIDRDVSRDSE